MSFSAQKTHNDDGKESERGIKSGIIQLAASAEGGETKNSFQLMLLIPILRFDVWRRELRAQ